MRVAVRAYATLRRHLPGTSLGEAVVVDLAPGSTVGDALDRLRIPHDEVKVCFVNGRQRDLSHHLLEGDEIGVFPPVGGG